MKRPEVEDVPIPTRARCMGCRAEMEIAQLKVIEHLLGGYVRAHCTHEQDITTWRPVVEKKETA